MPVFTVQHVLEAANLAMTEHRFDRDCACPRCAFVRVLHMAPGHVSLLARDAETAYACLTNSCGKCPAKSGGFPRCDKSAAAAAARHLREFFRTEDEGDVAARVT